MGSIRVRWLCFSRDALNKDLVIQAQLWFGCDCVGGRAFSFGDRKPHKHRDKLGLVKIEEFLGFKHDKSSKRKSPGVGG